MKKTRLYINGTRQKDVYLNRTKWQIFKYKVKKFFKRLFWGIVILGVCYGIFEAGAFINPKTVITKAEVIKEVPIKAEVLERIAKCESPTGHYKNGQVSIGANRNGSVDVGKYQINSLWFKKATEMGLDLTKEADNEAFAQWLYENRGTEDWSASIKCWYK